MDTFFDEAGPEAGTHNKDTDADFRAMLRMAITATGAALTIGLVLGSLIWLAVTGGHQ
jgi:hypothetical protein